MTSGYWLLSCRFHRNLFVLWHVPQLWHWSLRLHQAASVYSIGWVASRFCSPTSDLRHSLFLHLFLARRRVLHHPLVSFVRVFEFIRVPSFSPLALFLASLVFVSILFVISPNLFLHLLNSIFVLYSPFLDASSHLYKRVCPSVGWSVGPSIMLSLNLVKMDV